MIDEQQQATNGLDREDAKVALEASSAFLQALQPLAVKYKIANKVIIKLADTTLDLVAQVLGYCAIADEAGARIEAENAAVEATFESIFSEFKL